MQPQAAIVPRSTLAALLAARRLCARPWTTPVAALAAVCFGIAIGLAAWGNNTIPYAALLVPLLWASFANRSVVVPMCGVAAYQLAGLRGLFAGMRQFAITNTELGLFALALVVACMGIGLIWALPLKWCRRQWQVGAACVGVMWIMLLPPLWVLGAGSPVAAFGFVWEGGGWFAFVVLSALLGTLAGALHLLDPLRQGAVLLVALGVCVASSTSPDESFRGSEIARAVSTEWRGRDLDLQEQTDRLTKVGRLINGLAPLGVKWIILPESVIGQWTPALEFVAKLEVLQAAKKLGIEVWLGVDQRRADGLWDTGLQVIRADGASGYLPARQPMPVSLWGRLFGAGYGANWGRSAIVDSPIGPVYLSVCFEDVLPGMFLREMWGADRPRAIVSVANHWFVQPGNPLAAEQSRHIEGMARLFRLRLLRAVNRPPATPAH